MKIESRYKAQTGTYVSVVPDAGTVVYLVEALNSLELSDGRKSVPADFHCTVMFAPRSVLTAEQQLLALKKAPATFKATTKSLTSWVGGDGDSYIVLELDCPELEEYHLVLRDLGLEPSFADYRPHITMVSEMQAIPEGRYAVEPIPVTLSGLRIEDTK